MRTEKLVRRIEELENDVTVLRYDLDLLRSDTIETDCEQGMDVEVDGMEAVETVVQGTTEGLDEDCEKGDGREGPPRTYALLPSDFVATFAYWVHQQHWEIAPEIKDPINDFATLVSEIFTNRNAGCDNPLLTPAMFSDLEINILISEDVLGGIASIRELNVGKEFIDLAALARNIRQSLERGFE